ncbi:galactoside 2-alpha-L-fucosyltransferase [Elysia marginata]|uniref:L-Fucosyltransferase n=1 Tax=Elysia marginata TaxID=1093978 RepID=A0AAV4HLF3_9GAST|nr:galactoside 2-alpha-L-fucosyltransferase [Elysia marginata]
MGTKCKVLVYRLSLPVFLENLDPEGSVLPSDSRDLPKAERTYVGGRHLVCHTFSGGLGSLLFQYASAAGIASRQGRIIVATDGRRDDQEEDEDDMEELEDDIHTRKGSVVLERALKSTILKADLTQCRSVVRLTEAACCRFDERLMKLDRNKNYEIDGQLQSWRYFNKDLEAVREFVALKDSIIARAKRKISRSLAASNITSLRNAAAVGVHVRRGDKLHWSAVDAGVRVAPREFFLKAMRHFRKTLQGPVVFLVVSDDHDWCKSNLVGLPGVVLIESDKQRRASALKDIWKREAMREGKQGKGEEKYLQDTGGLKNKGVGRNGQPKGPQQGQNVRIQSSAKLSRNRRETAGGEAGIYLDGSHHHHDNKNHQHLYHHRHQNERDHDEVDKEDATDEAAVDLAVLSLVDHSIITVGAFSWWAGFLARGTVVYYGHFVDADSKLRSQFDEKMADYLLPGWIQIS